MDTIASAIERLEAILDRRADFGVGTNHSTTTCDDGMRCTTEEGHWQISSDLSESLGGSASAPTPGVLLRAALGGCMAMSYRLRAAKHGIELRSIRVTVEADSELAGMLLLDSTAPPGYTELRAHIEIDSPSPADEVLRILDEADRLSPLLDVFARATEIRRTATVRESEA